ncbi:MAG: DUF4132 domain-containing protein [Clostridiales bacterium]|nr:DUF4132 domain-containing protein [Clostridiales bacterium]
MNHFMDINSSKPASAIAVAYAQKLADERNRLLANISDDEKSFFADLVNDQSEYEYSVQFVNGAQCAEVQRKKTIKNVNRSALVKWVDNKCGSPSEFFLQKMPWIFGPIILPRFKDAFLWAVDHCNQWPYQRGWYRRSCRTENYAYYSDIMQEIASAFEMQMPVDADICDILEGNLPQDALEFTQSIQPGYCSYAIAYELEHGNERLETILTEAMTGNNHKVLLNHAMIRGILRSGNCKMNKELCRLLLASGAQEGLRQSICECADEGTTEAFRMIFNTIVDNNLIRFSSVKRAVGAWMGLFTASESSKTDRISNKSILLAKECLEDPAACARFLESEDSMQIHISLWSIAARNIENAVQSAYQLCKRGTNHQILTACYFIDQLSNSRLAHLFAKFCIEKYPDRMDVLAMCMQNFIPDAPRTSFSISYNKSWDDFSQYFADRQETEKFYTLMLRLLSEVPKKALEFSPCVFPWHSAHLSRSQFVDAVCILAVMLGDVEKIDTACTLLPNCTAACRSAYFAALMREVKSPIQRQILTAALADKEFSTQLTAFKIADTLPIDTFDITHLEEMLRFKSATARTNIIKLLLKQQPENILQSIERLVKDKLEERRCAAYDLMISVLKDEQYATIYPACKALINSRTAEASKERILLESVQSMLADKPSDRAELPFTEEDAYIPDISFVTADTAYMETYTRYFPDSHISKILKGTIPDLSSVPLCPSCIQAQQDLDSLHEIIAAHSEELYVAIDDMPPSPVFPLRHLRFNLEGTDGRVPRPELWKEWYVLQNLTPERILRALIRIEALTPEESIRWKSNAIINAFYGCGFAAENNYLHSDMIFAILESLCAQYVPASDMRMLASMIGYCYAKHIPESNILIQASRVGPATDTIASQAQLCILLRAIHCADDESLAQNFALGEAIFTRYLTSLKRYLVINGTPSDEVERYLTTKIECRQGHWWIPTVPMVLYEPAICDCLIAYRRGILTQKTLLHFAMAPHRLSDTLNTLSLISACYHSESGIPDLRGDSYGTHGKDALAMLKKNFCITDIYSEEAQSILSIAEKTYQTILSIVLDVELMRGDSVTAYTYAVSKIRKLYGCDYLGRILAALGNDTVVRGISWYGSARGKNATLCRLLYVSAPSAEDTVCDIARIVSEYDISEKRLIETAMYAPEWVDLIEEYLQIPGLKSAVYYFMAHMDEHFEAQRAAVIAKFTPLTADELNDGAFDLDWFHSAYSTLGEKEFQLLYDAAKYISDGAKHTRARKYADAALGLMDVFETELQVADKRNKDLLMAYALIPFANEDDLIHRYLFIQEFARQSKQHGAQRMTNERKAAEVALSNLARNAGYKDVTRLTLRMEAKLAEDNRALFLPYTIEDITVQLHVSTSGGVELLATKYGKTLKALPSHFKKDAYILHLNDAKKAFTEQYRRTKALFEEAMEEGISFTAEEIRIFAATPVVCPILESLVFMCGDRFGFMRNMTLTDACGKTCELSASDELIVAHPFHMYKARVWADYQRNLFDRRLIQPFRQVFRELYVKTQDELGQSRSLRYAGHQILPKKTASVLRGRRWIADYASGLQKVYYKENIIATIFAMTDWFTPADIEVPTLEHVAFYDRKTGREVKIDDIPDVIFSEIMRDVDLAVSVAHAGGYNPETSHSSIEMRAALLEFTLPLFKLNNVRISGKKAIINGSMASYSVHLGSGIIHQLDGAMIDVIPVHSQHRGRIFLPFADEDPKTSEILSKVLLFAEDKKIKDPSILSQIQR